MAPRAVPNGELWGPPSQGRWWFTSKGTCNSDEGGSLHPTATPCPAALPARPRSTRRDPVDVDVHYFVLILDILLVAFPGKMQKILSCIRHWKEAKKAKKARRKEQDKKRTEKGKGLAATPIPTPTPVTSIASRIRGEDWVLPNEDEV